MPKKPARKKLGRKELRRTRGGSVPAIPNALGITPTAGLTTSDQVSEVHVRGWDPEKRKEIVGK